MFNLFMSQNACVVQQSMLYGVEVSFRGFSDDYISATVRWFTDYMENPFNLTENELIYDSIRTINMTKEEFELYQSQGRSYLEIELSAPRDLIVTHGMANSYGYTDSPTEDYLEGSTYYRIETFLSGTEDSTILKIEIYKQ